MIERLRAATCAALFSAVSGGIIYLARGGDSEALHQLELRIQRIETVLSLPLKRTSDGMGTRRREPVSRQERIA